MWLVKYLPRFITLYSDSSFLFAKRITGRQRLHSLTFDSSHSCRNVYQVNVSWLITIPPTEKVSLEKAALSPGYRNCYGCIGLQTVFWLLPTCSNDASCHVQLQSPLPELSRDLLLLMLISREWRKDTFYAPVVCNLWRHETREQSMEAAVGERKMNGKNVKILWNDNGAWRLLKKQDISDMEHQVWVQPTKTLINRHQLSFN